MALTPPNYATLNFKRISTFDDLFYRWQHNRRLHTPSNIDPDRSDQNIHHHANAYKIIGERHDEINKIRKEAGVARLRKNITPAVELNIGASGEWFEGKTREEIEEWVKANLEWAKSYFKNKGGKMITYDVHFDEQNPHIQIIYMPETEKHDKRTNQIVPAFDAWSFIGQKKDLYQARDSHAEANKKFGLQRGINYEKEGKKRPRNMSVKELRALNEREEEKNKVFKKNSLDLEADNKQLRLDKTNLVKAQLQGLKDLSAFTKLVDSIDKTALFAFAKRKKTKTLEGLSGINLVRELFPSEAE
jgi:hypothetical protein